MMRIFMIIGCVLAVSMSWSAWHSVPWAIVHGFLNWIYVLYRCL